MARYSVGVDLGGTKIMTVLWDQQEERVVTQLRVSTGGEDGPDAVIGRIIGSVQDVLAQSSVDHAQVEGIGVGSPGPLNVKTGVVLCPPNLPGWLNIPLRERIQSALQLPTVIDNDANVAGLAEWVIGAGRGTDNMIYLTVSTGIGGAAIVDRRLQHGETGAATEFGHVIVDPHGPKCGCGNIGCLEAVASGTAIAREANAYDDLVGRFGRTLSTEDVFTLAKEGDGAAGKVVSTAIHYLSIGIANYIHIYDPSLVVVGGGVTSVGEQLFEPLREGVKRLVFPHLRDAVFIVPAQLGSMVGAIGAALLFHTVEPTV